LASVLTVRNLDGVEGAILASYRTISFKGDLLGAFPGVVCNRASQFFFIFISNIHHVVKLEFILSPVVDYLLTSLASFFNIYNLDLIEHVNVNLILLCTSRLKPWRPVLLSEAVLKEVEATVLPL